ncbi:MAG: aminotransferase class IV [Gemmataceae bacterium]
MSLVWINGQLVDKSEAKISVFDHGFLYGDGVWEHFRAFNGKLFRPEDGLVPLIGYSLFRHDDLIAAIGRTLEANNRREGYVRVIVTRGVGTIGPDPRKLDAQVIIIAEEYRPFPEELYKSGLQVVSCRLWFSTLSAFPNRTLGQWHILIAKQHALEHGCLDSVLIDRDDLLGYCTEGDIYIVQSGIIRASSGLSRDQAFARGFHIDIHRIQGFPAATRQLSLTDLHAADEVFLAGTSCGVIGIVQIDGKPIGSGTEGPITKRIREAYRKLTRGEA